MANHNPRGRRGRFSKGEGLLAIKVQVRLSAAQRATYVAAGGANWLRAQLDAEIVRQRLAPAPTAHNPFPTGPDRFTQNQCRITFPPEMP